MGLREPLGLPAGPPPPAAATTNPAPTSPPARLIGRREADMGPPNTNRATSHSFVDFRFGCFASRLAIRPSLLFVFFFLHR